MKNHIRVGGKLLQTNKRMSQLKQKQIEFIAESVWELHNITRSGQEHDLTKTQKDEIIRQVYERVEEKEIWIPFPEFRTYVQKKLALYSRRWKPVQQESQT
ncbi:hypothetical protein J2T17_004461 [Paenibacillus mucilaginosus]|uniref:transposase n=1 Tax=Paenibacillus mucilaginosus TaxID=61624 RepID=UPI003D1FEA2B